MEKRRQRGGKRRRRKSKEFMDAALDGYIRHVALQKWREVAGVLENLGAESHRAVLEAGSFPERGVYREIWERSWRVHLGAPDSQASLGRIEAAVGDAVREEIEARKESGDAPFEDGLDYKNFLDRALDRLFEEEAGSLEEI